MIILLYGKDSYRKKEKLDDILEGYRKKNGSGINIKILGEDVNFSEIEDDNKQFAMFQEKKLTVVRDALLKIREDLLKNIEKLFSSENIIVLYEEDVKKTDPLLKELLKRKALVQEFSLLSRNKTSSYIREKIESGGAEISDEALDLLLEFIGNDLWRAKTEIDKLISYSKKITRADVSNLVKANTEGDIFKTIDALAEKKKEEAVNLVYKHIEKGDHPLYILSMIGYQVRNLILFRDMIDKGVSYNQLASKTGVHPFVARKISYQVKSFSREKLEEIYNLLFEVDLKIKTGQIDPVLAVTLVLFKF